ncbi:MAG: TlpA family protein disulfide reductase [Planctomycetes bacterium]|nr:TlpA family protein disulfide reductase [Planctomycetota bacterium]
MIIAIALRLATVLLLATGDDTQPANPKAELDRIVARAAPKAIPADATKAAELLDAVERDLDALVTQVAGTDLESEARFQLATIQMRRSKGASAIAMLEKAAAAAKKPEAKVAALMLLAQAQQANSDATGAKRTFESFLKEFPNHEFAPRIRRALKLIDARARLVVGKPVPSFDKKDLDDRPFSTSALAGKVFLVDFCGTWCEPWRRDVPALKTILARFHDQGFEVAGVAMDGPDEQALRRFIAQEKITWPIYSDGLEWDNAIALDYGIETLPASVLVDRKGIVRFLNLPRAALASAVQALLAEKVDGKK